MVDVAIIGASGFGGAELLRLLANHPDFTVVAATADTQAGRPVAGVYPSLVGAYPDLDLIRYDQLPVSGLDLVFLALPHGASQTVVPELDGRVGKIVDLAADFRLPDPALYPIWYGDEHAAPELLADFVYGLPELFGKDLDGAAKVAVPGCYPTAALLALVPLVRAGLIETDGVIVDAASGVSGAGRDKFPFCGTDEDFVAYGLGDHRHTPEIELGIGGQVLFTPHLAPMNRGILATCYARPAAAVTTGDLLAAQRDVYADAPFVAVIDEAPHTKSVQGSNSAQVTARFDERTGWIMALAAIDNLGKGAAGQAIQCANIVCDLPEAVGLPVAGMYP